MPVPLRVLLVEDNADDADLILRQLARADFDLTSERVEDASGLVRALEGEEWDLVLADYSLPGFSGLEALRMITDRAIDVPLVLVSGAIDVPTALDAMKAGAKDFVLKDDTQRLPSVIERELADSAQRRRRRLAEAQRDHALEDLREANVQLSALVKLTEFSLHGMTPQALLEALLERLVATLHADGATVLMCQDERLVTRASVGPGADVTSDVPLGFGFEGTVAAEGRAMYVRDAVSDSSVTNPAIRASGIRSMLGVPMHLGEQVTGVLHVYWCSIVEPAEWLPPLLEIAADRCALALENARFYEHEHTIAETLQQALLSVSTDVAGLDVGHFYGSATLETLVGGDFYDLFPVSPGRVAFSIGDVSGKGLGAAAVTALVKNTLRAHAVDGDPPQTVLSKTNEVVGRFTPSDTFVTAIFGVLDLTDKSVTYCTAGHPSPAIVGPAGVRELVTLGPVLGAFDDSSYEAGTDALAPEETLVLYTDGLTEARDASGVFYGSERLLKFLATLGGAGPRDIAARLYVEIYDFSDGRLRDDAAVLALQPVSALGASRGESS